MQGPMRCRVRKIKKEGPIIWRFFDHSDGFVGDRIREIEIFRECFDTAVIFKPAMGREEMCDPVDYPVETIESALTWRCMLHFSHAPTIDFSGHEVSSSMPFGERWRCRQASYSKAEQFRLFLKRPELLCHMIYQRANPCGQMTVGWVERVETEILCFVFRKELLKRSVFQI